MATVTGLPGIQINATCTVSNDGQMVAQGESEEAPQSVCNDLATIRQGSYPTSATVTCTGTWTWNDPGQITCNGWMVIQDHGVSYLGTCKTYWDCPTASCSSDVPLGTYSTLPVAVFSPQGGSGTVGATPVILSLTTAPPSWLTDGKLVTYSGTGTSGETVFPINVTNYQPTAWAQTTNYTTANDQLFVGTMEPCVVYSNGFVWVCETAGTSSGGAGIGVVSVGSTQTDGTAVWRNMGALGVGIFALSGSIYDGTGAPSSPTITPTSQLRTSVARDITRALSGAQPETVIDDPTFGMGGNVAQGIKATWQLEQIDFTGPYTGSYKAVCELTYIASKGQYFTWRITEEDIPTGALLENVTVTFAPQGGGSAHGGLPSQMPTVYILRTDLRSGVVQGLSNQSLTGVGSVAAYEVVQKLTAAVGSGTGTGINAPGLPLNVSLWPSTPEPQPYEIVDHRYYQYKVVFVTEAATNALGGTHVYGARAKANTTWVRQI